MSDRLSDTVFVEISAPLDGLTLSTLPEPVPITRTPEPSKAIEAYWPEFSGRFARTVEASDGGAGRGRQRAVDAGQGARPRWCWRC